MEESNHQLTRTRIAPTPSGFLHLGNVFSFVITAAIAEQTGAKILLRIDDLDRDRVRKEYVQDIFDTLNFLDIPWHEGPRDFAAYEAEFSQTHRLVLYNDALGKLRESEQLFACSCSRTQVRLNNPEEIYAGTCRDRRIPFDREDISWRLNTDSQKEIVVKTLDQGIIKTHLPAAMQDFVVRKKDGYPAYQLASVVDDVYFGVDLIVRGEDLWESTLAQLYLATQLHADNFQQIVFHHHKLLSEKGGEKLSKSAGDTSVNHLRRQGKKPGDIFSEIALLLGFKETIADWRQLIALVQGKNNQIKS